MFPPVLEIYVIWHPKDEQGQVIAQEFLEHFHGPAFSGLIGDGIEIYIRSDGCGRGNKEPTIFLNRDADLTCMQLVKNLFSINCTAQIIN